MIKFIEQLRNTRFIGFAALCIISTSLVLSGFLTGGEWVTSAIGLYSIFAAGKTLQKFAGGSKNVQPTKDV